MRLDDSARVIAHSAMMGRQRAIAFLRTDTHRQGIYAACHAFFTEVS